MVAVLDLDVDVQALGDFLGRATAESSSLTRSFWYGKFLQSSLLQPCLQRLQTHGGGAHGESNPPQACELEVAVPGQLILGKTLLMHVDDALECLTVRETSLSPNVFELVARTISSNQTSNPPGNVLTLPHFLCQDCTLNWLAIAEYLGKDVMERIDCSAGARKCGMVARHIFDEINRATTSSLLQSMEENLTWTHAPEVFTECLREMRTGDPLRVHVSLLIGSATLERSLGDVYLTVSEATQTPSLLRDLLATDELEGTFGSTAMCCLRCLIGPPSGLNLRNILWHGFPAQDEIPEEYAYFLLVLVSSLGKALRVKESPPLPLTHRQYTTFPQEPVIAGVFRVIQDDDLPAVLQLFSHSYFILPTMLPTWKAAVEAFRVKRFGHCLVLLLPALEHSLRRVFACINGCPERAITAESTALYTTFDEILDPLLPGGAPNRLGEEIGQGKMEMLLDLLVHPEGPRLRDRVSHGEVDFNILSGTFSNHALCMGVVFCAQYVLDKNLTLRPPIARCLAVEARYTSLFHPVSLLRRELIVSLVPSPTPSFPSLLTVLSSDGKLGVGLGTRWSFQSKYLIIQLQQLVSDLDGWYHIVTQDYCGEEDEEGGREEEGGEAGEGLKDDTFLRASQEALECVVLHRRPEVFHGLEHLFQDDSLVHCSCLLELLHCVWAGLPPTLHTARQDLELTGVLRKTVENATMAVTHVRETAAVRHKQFEQKQLRSRQRDNYQHLLKSLRNYQSAVILLVVLVVAAASHIPLDPHTSKKIIRFHKRVLQFAENFFSQTSPSRNRWEEADHLCLSLAGLVRQSPLPRNPSPK